MSVEEISTRYHNFKHAGVDRVDLGPRREAMLTISPVAWIQGVGQTGPLLKVRFGGIENFEAVSEKFQEIMSLRSEIAFLGLDPDGIKKRGGPYIFKYIAERTDFEFRFKCQNVTIKSAS